MATQKAKSALVVDNDSVFTTNGNQEILGVLQNEFNADVLESVYLITDHKAWLADNVYVTTKSYVTGNLCTYEGRLLVSNDTTTGAFDATKWDDLFDKQSSAFKQDVTEAAGVLDIGGVGFPVLKLLGTGVITVNTIINGVHGRKYRLLLQSGITNLTITNTAVATVVSSGTGQVSNGTGVTSTILKGNTQEEMGDYVEFVYYKSGALEGNAITNVIKH